MHCVLMELPEQAYNSLRAVFNDGTDVDILRSAVEAKLVVDHRYRQAESTRAWHRRRQPGWHLHDDRLRAVCRWQKGPGGSAHISFINARTRTEYELRVSDKSIRVFFVRRDASIWLTGAGVFVSKLNSVQWFYDREPASVVLTAYKLLRPLRQARRRIDRRTWASLRPCLPPELTALVRDCL